MRLKVFIGSDPREQQALAVCEGSLRKHSSIELDVMPLRLSELESAGIYNRPHEVRDGRLWDVISDLPMSTEFAISRFLTPHLSGYADWALYCDCDFLFRADVAELLAYARDSFAVMVVKHCYISSPEKMDAQFNIAYERKNWSSLMLFNCGHEANMVLTPSMINAVHRRVLDRLAWVSSEDIGGLPFEWNWLELQPRAVHFTHGTPDMPNYENAAYADEYRRYG
jgi:hypothetical protein